MSKTEVNLNIDGTHASITFTTESGVNVMSPDVLHSLGAAIARIKKESAVRTATIQAKGKVFLAGADIKVMSTYSVEDGREYGSMGQGMLDDLESLPCITVCSISGMALGGGLELALACDFRIAVKHAQLGLPEVTLGLIPGWGGIMRLSRLIGPSKAKKIYLSGMPVSAGDAVAYGLVDEVVNSVEDLHSRVSAFCKTFRRAAPEAVALAKHAYRDHDDLTAFADCFATKNCREGIRAFLNKQTTSWME